MTIVRVTPESSAEDSLVVTQVFCRLMLQTNLIAIPAYIGLFMMAVPFDVDAGVTKGIVLATPVIEFAIAAVISSIAFLITSPNVDRESFDSLSRMKSRIITRKLRLILSASFLFLLGILSGTFLLLKAHL